MPRPATPYYVDGLATGAQGRSMLDKIIDMVYGANPTRSEAANLSQSLNVFRLMYRKDSKTWLRKPFFRIGRDGAGPAVWPAEIADL